MEDDYAFFKSVLQTSCIQSTEKKETVNLVILLSIRDKFHRFYRWFKMTFAIWVWIYKARTKLIQAY